MRADDLRQSLWAHLADDWQKHGRRYLIEGLIFAVLVAGIAFFVRRATDPQVKLRVAYHEMMAELCSQECDLMDRRAADCRARAERGAAWDDASEEAEGLRACPYPWDPPQTPSWADQADVWERAATKGRRTVERHRWEATW